MDSNMDVNVFRERIRELVHVLKQIEFDVKSGISEDKLKHDYEYLNTEMAFFFPQVVEKNCMFYRARKKNWEKDNAPDLSSPSTFSYYPLAEQKKKPCAIGRANFSGQSIFYASNHAMTNYCEIGADIGDEVFLGQWKCKEGETISVFPMLMDFVRNLCGEDSQEIYLYRYLLDFYSLMTDTVCPSTEWKYKATALFANAIYEFELQKGVSGKLYDGIMYPSVKAANEKEFNFAFVPHVVDQKLELNYVIKGSVNQNKSSLNIQAIAFYEEDRLVWYQIDVCEDSVEIIDCFFYDEVGAQLDLTNGEVVLNGCLIDIHRPCEFYSKNVNNAELLFSKETYNYDFISKEHFHKQIQGIVKWIPDGMFYKKGAELLPICCVKFNALFNMHLVPVVI